MARASQIEINPKRLEYLLKLFHLSQKELQERIQFDIDFSKPLLSKTQLKEIDKIFNKGLNFYTDPSDIDTKNSSILFRKNNLNATLDIGDRQFISRFEEEISYIASLAKLGDFSFRARKLQTFSLQDSPTKVAKQMQFLLPMEKTKDDKSFLQSFTENLSKQDILVLEYIEAPAKTYKTNLCGFFIAPNAIVLKKQSHKREIFTLAHELGHYLLNKENVDENIFEPNSNDEELWCNEFAFALLLGDKINELQDIRADEIELESQVIKDISQEKHISRLALFYHFALKNKIAWDRYNELKQDLSREYEQNKLKDNKKIKFPIALLSPLQKDIFVNAFLEGVIDEYVLQTRFERYIKNHNLESFIYG